MLLNVVIRNLGPVPPNLAFQMSVLYPWHEQIDKSHHELKAHINQELKHLDNRMKLLEENFKILSQSKPFGPK